MANRRRPIPKRIWFTEEEWHLVEAKMVEAEMTNFSAFGLEMLLHGEVRHYDFSNGDVIVIDREKTDFLIVIFWMMHRIESEVGGHQLIQMVGKGTAKMRNPKWDIFCTSP